MGYFVIAARRVERLSPSDSYTGTIRDGRLFDALPAFLSVFMTQLGGRSVGRACRGLFSKITLVTLLVLSSYRSPCGLIGARKDVVAVSSI